MINKRVKEHNGITFTMYETELGRNAEAALQGGKYLLNGKQSVTIADGQYKYGDEVIIQVYNVPGSLVLKERVAETYDRIQIFFKKVDFLELCKQILEDTK